MEWTYGWLEFNEWLRPIVCCVPIAVVMGILCCDRPLVWALGYVVPAVGLRFYFVWRHWWDPWFLEIMPWWKVGLMGCLIVACVGVTGWLRRVGLRRLFANSTSGG